MSCRIADVGLQRDRLRTYNVGTSFTEATRDVKASSLIYSGPHQVSGLFPKILTSQL
jgi:hypothetical protein